MSAEIVISLPDEAATATLGARLAPLLRAGDVVALTGPLGAGKTTLARGLIAALTGEPDAASPTFGLVLTYECQTEDREAPPVTLYHFDLYRLEEPDDVWELGLEDAIDFGISVIEWPERIAGVLPPESLVVAFDHGDIGRHATIRFLPESRWRELPALLGASTP